MPPPKPSKPIRKTQPPTPEEIKKGELHPYWIERYRHYHLGDKRHVAKVEL